MLNLALLFGGRSAEHDVSILSAKSFLNALDQSQYQLTLVYITPEGKWFATQDAQCPLEDIPAQKQQVHLHLDPQEKGLLVIQDGQTKIWPIDVVFPLLHGPFGEDGRLQGLLDWANLPYVGSGVTASTLGMDKHYMKIVFADAGLPQVAYFVSTQKPEEILVQAEDRIGYPCIVKPANLGSSVGINKAHTQAELLHAINIAKNHDTKVIIEQFLQVRELECSVLGNQNPQASVIGEIIPEADFYDYEAKYLSGTSKLVIGADIPPAAAQTIQEMALRAYQALGCAGLSRVDFFYTQDTQQIYINEINTLPGFTQFSMYPRLWEPLNITYSNLIDRLIQLALAQK